LAKRRGCFFSFSVGITYSPFPLQPTSPSRISATKKFLAASLSIKETAADVGVRDEFYFMRLFKKNAGAFAKPAK